AGAARRGRPARRHGVQPARRPRRARGPPRAHRAGGVRPGAGGVPAAGLAARPRVAGLLPPHDARLRRARAARGAAAEAGGGHAADGRRRAAARRAGRAAVDAEDARRPGGAGGGRPGRAQTARGAYM
ncbi:MAG: hypothetical protein AVDCRST_MAG66-3259, partial [uncultured Pseudonocardia sp.]